MSSLLYDSLNNFEGKNLFNFKDFGILDNDSIDFNKFDEFSDYDWSKHLDMHETIKIIIKEMMSPQLSLSIK